MNQVAAFYLSEARKWAKLRNELYKTAAENIRDYPEFSYERSQWWFRRIAVVARRIEQNKADFRSEQEFQRRFCE